MADIGGYVTGKMIGVTFKGKALYCTGGNNERSVGEVRLNNSKEGCFAVVGPGLRSSRGSLTCMYHGDDPPLITEGDFGELIIDAIGANCVDVGHPGGRVITVPIMVVSINDTWATDGEYTWVLTYASTGAYTVVEPEPAGGGGGGGGV